MSGAGAVAEVRICIPPECRAGSGRPVRWLVTIAGEAFFFGDASARNSNAKSTKPATVRNARTRIAAWLTSERNAIQDQQAYKNGRKRQTKHLCSRTLTCICHDVDPCTSIFVSAGKD